MRAEYKYYSFDGPSQRVGAPQAHEAVEGFVCCRHPPYPDTVLFIFLNKPVKKVCYYSMQYVYNWLLEVLKMNFYYGANS